MTKVSGKNQTVQESLISDDQLSKTHLRLWLRLLKSVGLITGDLRRRFRDEFQTTLPRFDVMSVLIRSPDGLKMSEISRLLRVSNGNVTGIVDRLVEDGLALRVAQLGDRRANVIHLTPAGRENFEIQAKTHENWIDGLLAELEKDEAELMLLQLDRLISTLEKNTDG